MVYNVVEKRGKIMTKYGISHRFMAIFVMFAIISSISIIPVPKVKAEQPVLGYVNGISVNVREGPGTNYRSLGKLTHVQVQILGSANDNKGQEWKKIRYGSLEGYMTAEFITIIDSKPDINKPFEEQIADFPEDYKAQLRIVHANYPNWTFEADHLSVSFDETINAESVFPKKLVPYNYSISLRSMGKGAYNWSSGEWKKTEGSWVGASREVIAYYMDPRNFLNISDIYMFADLTYDRNSQTADGVRSIVSGTFLERGFNDKSDYNGSYIDIIMAAAEQTNISPYMLASTIRMEQGVNGSSALISGEYPGYEGYYNFLNFGSTGGTQAQVIENGLRYAKRNGWSSRSKSIIGGAQKLAGNYFQNGQNTYYYKNFDVRSGNFSHQYAQSIYDSKSSSANLRKLYIGDKNSQLHFIIPVYKYMWENPAPKPAENNKKNNYYFTSLDVPGFDMYKQEYSLSMSGNRNIKYSVPSGAAYSGPTSFSLSRGNNTIVLPVTAETGAVNYYRLNVSASSSCTLTIGDGGDNPNPPVSVVLGDTNGDNRVSIIDLANVQKHLLKIITLTGNNYIGADTNKDGKISIIDLANIQKHLLNIITLG